VKNHGAVHEILRKLRIDFPSIVALSSKIKLMSSFKNNIGNDGLAAAQPHKST
jgi:hypothetical protein